MRWPESNVVPIGYFRCPTHQAKIPLDGAGRLLRLCAGCEREALEGIRKLRRRKVLSVVR
jgi:hypothetical protein